MTKKKCTSLSARANGYTQMMHTMTTLYSAGEVEEAHKLLHLIQAKLEVLSIDMHMEYHRSGEGKA